MVTEVARGPTATVTAAGQLLLHRPRRRTVIIHTTHGGRILYIYLAVFCTASRAVLAGVANGMDSDRTDSSRGASTRGPAPRLPAHEYFKQHHLDAYIQEALRYNGVSLSHGCRDPRLHVFFRVAFCCAVKVFHSFGCHFR